MFTGIVEEIGTVVRLEPHPDGAAGAEQDARLVLRGPKVTEGTRLGDSIAVAGVCLTVTANQGGDFAVDVMPETLRHSTLGSAVPGTRVNLERAVRADGRLDGHLVQGHVDGVGELLSRDPGPRWDDLVIGCPPDLARYVARKGSIAIDGVSLTVTTVGPDRFGVSLIPTTLAATTLGQLRPGDRVNLEVDVIAKYVERLLTADHRAGGAGAPGAGETAEAAEVRPEEVQDV